MNLLQPEQRLQALARDYALGTLVGPARRRFERVLRDSAAARQAVEAWHARLAHLAQGVPPMRPSDAVWRRLDERLFPATSTPTARGWRAWLPGRGAWAGLAAGVLVSLVLVQQRPDVVGLEAAQDALPQSYVGLLTDANGAPVLLASSRRQGRLLSVKMLKPLEIPPGKVARLWALPKDGAPFAVGVVPAQGKAVLTLPDSSEKLFFNVPRLAVSLEPAPGGAAPGAPFVLSGHCVKLW